MSLFLHPQDYKTGFGGQFGVQKDRVDASAAGWDHVEKVAKHSSQQGRIPVHGNWKGLLYQDFYVYCMTFKSFVSTTFSVLFGLKRKLIFLLLFKKLHKAICA